MNLNFLNVKQKTYRDPKLGRDPPVEDHWSSMYLIIIKTVLHLIIPFII
jgi:hypothetical protein